MNKNIDVCYSLINLTSLYIQSLISRISNIKRHMMSYHDIYIGYVNLDDYIRMIFLTFVVLFYLYTCLLQQEMICHVRDRL